MNKLLNILFPITISLGLNSNSNAQNYSLSKDFIKSYDTLPKNIVYSREEYFQGLGKTKLVYLDLNNDSICDIKEYYFAEAGMPFTKPWAYSFSANNEEGFVLYYDFEENGLNGDEIKEDEDYTEEASKINL